MARTTKARASGADTAAALRARIAELEDELAVFREGASERPMSFRVAACLKEIIRHPERAPALAKQALAHL